MNEALEKPAGEDTAVDLVVINNTNDSIGY